MKSLSIGILKTASPDEAKGMHMAREFNRAHILAALDRKLDDNIGTGGQALLRSAGHDVATVRDQALQGASDETIFDVCSREGRTLITL
ncbi:MAG: DUF5615 family PIN-like protein [Chromatiales bacterium]